MQDLEARAEAAFATLKVIGGDALWTTASAGKSEFVITKPVALLISWASPRLMFASTGPRFSRPGWFTRAAICRGNGYARKKLKRLED
jgi:hypothetical protein